MKESMLSMNNELPTTTRISKFCPAIAHSKSGGEALKALDAIALTLQNFKSQYPQVFRHLCEAAREGADFTLADALSALDWAANYLAGEEE
jgi:hypothetical protein